MVPVWLCGNTIRARPPLNVRIGKLRKAIVGHASRAEQPSQQFSCLGWRNSFGMSVVTPITDKLLHGRDCPLCAKGLNRSRDSVLRRAARAMGYWDVSCLLYTSPSPRD